MSDTKRLFSCIFILIPALVVSASSTASPTMESSYDIAELYDVKEPMSGTKAIDEYGDASSVEYLLTPIKVDTGKYVVEVKKIGNNLYQIKDTDICVETRYCHEWASFAEEVVLIIESNYGYTKGKIIFD